MKAVAAWWGTSTETVCQWVRQAEVDVGQVPRMPTESVRKVHELKRKCAELERTMEVLKAVTSFFAGSATRCLADL